MWVRLATDDCCAKGIDDDWLCRWLPSGPTELRKRLVVQVRVRVRLLPLGCCVDVGIVEVDIVVDVIAVALVVAADRSAERILAIYPGINSSLSPFFLSPFSLSPLFL